MALFNGNSMRFIIDIVRGTSEEEVSQYMEDNGCEIVQVLNRVGQIYVVEADVMPNVPLIVEAVVPDDVSTKVKLLSDEVELSALEVKSTDIELEDNWWKLAIIPNVDLDNNEVQIIKAAKGVRVYLLDSGIEAEHEEFAGKDITLVHSMTDDFVDNTGHGTALASIIVGEECGITNANIRVVKIFDPSRPTLISDLLVAFDALLEDHETFGKTAAVVNLSWTINRNVYVENKIRSLISEGLIVCAAAGNSGIPIWDATPAAMPEVITVGAFGPDLRPSNFTNYTGESDTSYTAGMTNFGAGLDVFAPGESIRVAKRGGGFGYTAGTSASAAIASACASICVAYFNFPTPMPASSYVEVVTHQRVISGLLTLERKYAASPNLVVRASIKEFNPLTDTNAAVSAPFIVLEAGKEFRFWAFDPTTFDSAKLGGELEELGARYEGNFIVGTVPVGGKRVYTITQDLSSELTNYSSSISIVGYNPTTMTQKEALAESGIVLLDECSGCPTFCCSCGDVKTGCSFCAIHILNGEGQESYYCP